MKKITIYADRGHAWGAVKMDELDALGIADKISEYSYQRGDIAYLEEDCDLGLYLNAIKAAGEGFEFVEKYTDGDSPIRSFGRFTGAAK